MAERSRHTPVSNPRTRSPRKTTAARKRKPSGRRRRKTSEQRLRQLRVVLIRLGVIFISGLVAYLAYIYLVAPFSSKWRAKYGDEIYPEGYSIRGIDISHHQGTIDWDKLSRSKIGDEGISFVFIKATEGQNFLDENFNDNFYQARENGLLRGAYHYFKPSVPAKAQAQYFMKQVHLEPGDLPPVLDIEEKGDLSVAQLQKAARTWLDAVEKRYGVPPIIYTNYKFKQSYLDSKDFDKYPYWIAHYYVRNLTYKGPWKFWQHTDCGKLNGVREKVDLNIYNGSMYDLRRLCLEEKD